MTDHPASFTPGPWRLRRNEREAPDDLIVMNKEGDSIADFSPGNPSISLAEARANARLIAASPDLYAALERCIEVLEFAYMNAPKQPKEIKIGRQALAKAR